MIAKALRLALTLLLLPALAHAQDTVVGEFQAGGQTYVLILRPKQVLPPIPPDPIRRHVYGIQAADGTWLEPRETRSGDVIRLKGEGLGTERRPVFVAGIAAEVLTWDPETVVVRVGRAERNEIGPVRIRGTDWEVLSPFDVSVLPPWTQPLPPPDPLPPLPGSSVVIYGYTGTPGEPIIIDGKGFGDVPGTVLQDGTGVEVVLWSDTRIVVTSRGSKGGATFWVIRPDGKGYYGGMMR